MANPFTLYGDDRPRCRYCKVRKADVKDYAYGDWCWVCFDEGRVRRPKTLVISP